MQLNYIKNYLKYKHTLMNQQMLTPFMFKILIIQNNSHVHSTKYC